MIELPVFPGKPRKNDALFIYGASQPKPFIHVYWQEQTEIVHGPSCKAEKEIHLKRCAKNGVPILERRGGGGTVVLSPGMLITVIVGNRQTKDGALDIFNRVHEGFIRALSCAGINDVEKMGISDLAIKGKKILGSSLYLGTRPMLYYYQSSLMVHSDTELIERYLLHPPKEPDYRQGRDHIQFCTTLKTEYSRADTSGLLNLLKDHLHLSAV